MKKIIDDCDNHFCCTWIICGCLCFIIIHDMVNNNYGLIVVHGQIGLTTINYSYCKIYLTYHGKSSCSNSQSTPNGPLSISMFDYRIRTLYHQGFEHCSTGDLSCSHLSADLPVSSLHWPSLVWWALQSLAPVGHPTSQPKTWVDDRRIDGMRTGRFPLGPPVRDDRFSQSHQPVVMWTWHWIDAWPMTHWKSCPGKNQFMILDD